MITAYFKWTDFVIDLSEIDEKYLWKKITFKLMYGLEVIWDSESEQYSQVKRKTITYNWEKELILELNEVKDWYRWKKIFIWYYLEVDFWKKFLLFRDSKEIDIKWREESVYYANHLNVASWKYRNFNDKVDFKEIIKSMSLFTKIFMILLIIIWLVISILVFKDNGWDYAAFLIFLPFLWIDFLIYKFSWWDIISPYINYEEWKNNISDIITGTFKKDLESVYIELFALNTEEAHFVHQDWTTTRYVDFDLEVWNVLLFEKEIKDIKSWDKLEDLLKNEWKLDFSKMYENLFPTVSVSWTRWLFTKLELRISNDKFRDATYRKRIYFNRDNFSKKIKLNNSKQINNRNIKTENIENNNKFNSDFFE
jgi:hypothetical protein